MATVPPVTAADVTGWLERLAETLAQQLYEQYRATSDPDQSDLPEWDDLEPDLFDEDEPDPKGWYRARASELLTGSLAPLMAAVRGVLAEHKPYTRDVAWNSTETICGTCRYDDGLDAYVWPCPTVSAVVAALGAEVTGR